MTRTESDSERLACLDGALAARWELAWSLFVLAGASALAARLEPPLGAFWDWSALIAACASALAGADALGARNKRDAALDVILIVSAAAIVARLRAGDAPASAVARVHRLLETPPARS